MVQEFSITVGPTHTTPTRATTITTTATESSTEISENSEMTPFQSAVLYTSIGLIIGFVIFVVIKYMTHHYSFRMFLDNRLNRQPSRLNVQELPDEENNNYRSADSENGHIRSSVPEQNNDNGLSGIEISVISRIIARQSQESRLNRTRQNPGPQITQPGRATLISMRPLSQPNMPQRPHSIGPDLPPSYDEVLLEVDSHSGRTSISENGTGTGVPSYEWDADQTDLDCPPPSYWSSALKPLERNGFR